MVRKSFCAILLKMLRFYLNDLDLFLYNFKKYATKGTIKGKIFQDGYLLMGTYSSEIYTDDEVTILYKEGSSVLCNKWGARSVNMTLSYCFIM